MQTPPEVLKKKERKITKKRQGRRQRAKSLPGTMERDVRGAAKKSKKRGRKGANSYRLTSN